MYTIGSHGWKKRRKKQGLWLRRLEIMPRELHWLHNYWVSKPLFSCQVVHQFANCLLLRHMGQKFVRKVTRSMIHFSMPARVEKKTGRFSYSSYRLEPAVGV